MDVLIVGGTRFVGYLLAWRLIARGDRVTLVNRGTRPDPFGERVERLRADRTTADFARLLQGRRFDAAVDFAAYEARDPETAAALLGHGRVGHYVFVSTGQVSPFDDPWMSELDATRAGTELGFRPEAVASYLPKIVAAFLAAPPTDRPEGYRHRPRERAFSA